MAALTGNKIKDSYLGLLKTTNSGILTSSFVRITDGGGNGSQLYLSNTAIRFYDAYTFPSADGTVGQVLTTDANGALSWADSSDNQTLEEVLTSGNTATLAILSTADGNTFGSTTFDAAVTGTTANFTTSVTSPSFIGDIDGALIQQVKAAEALSKGDVVYISGGTGDNPEVSKAKADSATTMAALGIIKNNIAEDAIGECITSGELTGLNLTGFSTGDELFVSDATAGVLVTTAPTGVSNLIQKIGKVIKGGNGGALTVLGAFRVNALPNLPTGVVVGNGTSTVSASSNFLIASDGTITLYQPNNVPTDLSNYNIGGGNIALNTGGFNTGFGKNNLSQVGFTGSNNSAFGHQSSFAMTTGDNNTSVGFSSLLNETVGDDNTAIGHYSLFYSNNGNYNTAIGSYSLYTNSSGGQNVALGYEALRNNTTSSHNTALGYRALKLSTGDHNLAVGYNSGNLITSGTSNVVLGSFSGYRAASPTVLEYDIRTTSNNIVISDGAGTVYQSFDNSGAVRLHTYGINDHTGTLAKTLGVDANGNVIEFDAAGDVTKIDPITANQIAVWNDSTDELRSDETATIETDHSITLLQKNSLGTNLSTYNIGGGNIANVTGTNNTGFGEENLDSLTSGYHNTAIGYRALRFSQSASGNTAIGYQSLENYGNDSSHINSVAVGTLSGGRNTGGNNTFIGSSSGRGSNTPSNNVGGSNSALGLSSLQDLTSGSYNTAIGNNALEDLTTGSRNITLGYSSGSAITTGSYNVIIGSNTGSTIATSSNNIIISDGGGTSRIQVDGGGVVGIGVTPSPQSGGALAGSLETDGILRVRGANGSYFTSGDGLELSKTSIYSYNRDTPSGYNTLSINDTITVEGAGAATFSGALNGTSAKFTSTCFVNSPTNNAVISTSDATNIANGFNLLGSSSYWGIRTSSSGDIKLDVFGGGTPINALSITQSTGAATFSGNVGIGVSPSSGVKLNTYNATTATQIIVTGADATNQRLEVTDGTVTNRFGIFGRTTGDAGVIGTQTNHPLIFNTNDSEKMRIESGGAATFQSSVTANTFVEIVGDLRFNSTSADRSIYFRGSAGSVDTNWKMGNYVYPTGATVVTNAAIVIDIYNGAGYGFMIRNTSNVPLLQIEGSTGDATFSKKIKFASTSLPAILDSSESTVTLANGGTQNYAVFSGMIIVNSHTNGVVNIWMVGGNYVNQIATTAPSIGSVAYNGSINGYIFTNNTGSTHIYSFTGVKTRANG